MSIFFCDMYFDKQEFMVMHKCSAYYASIMLNTFKHLLCSLLCQHNRWWVSTLKLLQYWLMPLKSSSMYHRSTTVKHIWLNIQNWAGTFLSEVSCTIFRKLFTDLAKLWHKAWLHWADHFLKQLDTKYQHLRGINAE